MRNIVMVADLHTGHYTGLTPRPYQILPNPEGDPRGKYLLSAHKLWDWFEKKTVQARKEDGPFDLCICNGDLLDGRGERAGGLEIIIPDRKTQAKAAADAISFFDAKEYRLTYGTASHTGKEEDYEDITAEKLGAPKPGAELHLDIEGLIINARHKQPNTKSVASKFTGMAGEASRQLEWAMEDQAPLANVLIRSHTHRCYIIDEGSKRMYISTPALQGLGDKFGSREFGGLPISFGFITMKIHKGQVVKIKKWLAPLTMQAAHVEKL